MQESVAFAGILCPLLHGQDAPAKPKEPIASVTLGYTYLYADQGGKLPVGAERLVCEPAFTLGKGYSDFADFTSDYGYNAKGAVNSHGYTFGLQKSVFAHPRFKPAIFAESGDVRASSAGTVVWRSGPPFRYTGRVHLALSEQRQAQRLQRKGRIQLPARKALEQMSCCCGVDESCRAVFLERKQRPCQSFL